MAAWLYFRARKSMGLDRCNYDGVFQSRITKSLIINQPGVEMPRVAVEPFRQSFVLILLGRRIDAHAKQLRTHGRVLQCSVQVGTDDAILASAVSGAVVKMCERRDRLLRRRHAEMNFVGAE